MENELISKGARYLLMINDYQGECNTCKKPNNLYRPTLVCIIGMTEKHQYVAIPMEMLFCPHCEGLVRELYILMREPTNQTSIKEEE